VPKESSKDDKKKKRKKKLKIPSHDAMYEDINYMNDTSHLGPHGFGNQKMLANVY
jgi:hypothetical protein